MKRSERFFHKAKRKALWCAAILSASCAGCVWLVALIDPLPSGGMPAAALGAAGLFFAAMMAREAAHYLRLAKREERWEWEREIRPRL